MTSDYYLVTTDYKPVLTKIAGHMKELIDEFHEYGVVDLDMLDSSIVNQLQELCRLYDETVKIEMDGRSKIEGIFKRAEEIMGPHRD